MLTRTAVYLYIYIPYLTSAHTFNTCHSVTFVNNKLPVGNNLNALAHKHYKLA